MRIHLGRLSRFALLAATIPLVLSLGLAAQVSIGLSVRIGPPPLPVYAQPMCPAPGYIWTPGYWAWGPGGYYWAPGAWVMPPVVGVVWTPGYWGWDTVTAVYVWHVGYWGPHVGFYGGVNYGYGYPGRGYYGGRWRGGHFYYNREVNRVNINVIHNTYVSRVTYRNNSRVSYNGGHGGVNARPTAFEHRAFQQRRYAPTAGQRQHWDRARARDAQSRGGWQRFGQQPQRGEARERGQERVQQRGQERAQEPGQAARAYRQAPGNERPTAQERDRQPRQPRANREQRRNNQRTRGQDRQDKRGDRGKGEHKDRGPGHEHGRR